MSWADKAHKKNKIDKMIEQAMRSPKYQEAKKKEMEQATLQALCLFCFLMCEFLELNHRYGHKGLTRFLVWAKGRVEEIGNDETYFLDAESYYKEYHDVDILKVLGLIVAEREEDEA